MKGVGRHIEHLFHLKTRLQHDAQAAIVGAVRGGHHAIDHLFLQHEVLVLHHVHMVEQVKQDGRGDVVGQVAHHAQLGRVEALGQFGEVDLQHIRFGHAQLGVATQFSRQIAVDFNHLKVPEPLHQRLGQRGPAGANFHHGLPGLGGNGADDVVNDRAIGQKVLAKTLAWRVRVGHAQSGSSRYST